MEKKIASTIDVDDNNFSFDNYHNRDLDHDTACDNNKRTTYQIRELAFDTKDNTARDINERKTYQVH